MHGCRYVIGSGGGSGHRHCIYGVVVVVIVVVVAFIIIVVVHVVVMIVVYCSDRSHGVGRNGDGLRHGGGGGRHNCHCGGVIVEAGITVLITMMVGHPDGWLS